MFVRIRGVQPSGLERLEGFVYRPQIRHLNLDHRAYRLVPGTAADGLVLWVPAAADYTSPYALSQNAHHLVVRRGFGTQSRAGRVTYDFEQIPIRPFGHARA